MKTVMFANGDVLVEKDNGYRKASVEESAMHYASLVPASKKLNGIEGKLVAVKHEDGMLKAKYAFKNESGEEYTKVFGKKIEASFKVEAQAPAKRTEPLDSGDKAKPALDVPRKPGVGFKQHDGKEPVKVRKEKYEPGKEQEHTDVVPRSKGNAGLKGSDSISFENVGKTDSGNPDTYVQKFTDSDKPAAAGSEKNHAVAEKQTAIKLAKTDEGESDDKEKDADDSAEKSDKKEEKSEGKKLPDFLKKKEANAPKETAKKADEDNVKEASTKKALREQEVILKERTEELTKAKTEINRYKIREARIDKAIEFVLALQNLSPEKYANSETFIGKVNEMVKKMSPEALENAIVEVREAIKEANAMREKITKAAGPAAPTTEAGWHIPYVKVHTETDIKQRDTDRLREILQSSSTLGKQVADHEDYEAYKKKIA